MTLKDQLIKMNACPDAVTWVGDKTLTEAWDTCERADWMLWLTARSKCDVKKIVLTACAIARTALPYVTDGETRPLIAIETAEAWCRGEATIEQVKSAANAAYTAAYAANAAAYAANAAAYAANAAAYAANAAYTAANAAYTAAGAAYQQHADIVRSIITVKDLGIAA